MLGFTSKIIKSQNSRYPHWAVLKSSSRIFISFSFNHSIKLFITWYLNLTKSNINIFSISSPISSSNLAWIRALWYYNFAIRFTLKILYICLFQVNIILLFMSLYFMNTTYVWCRKEFQQINHREILCLPTNLRCF